MISFALPLAFVLLPLPFLAAALLPRSSSHPGAFVVPSAIACNLGGTDEAAAPGHTRRLLPSLLWLSLVCALAGPQVLSPTRLLPTSGRDIVLALDLSGSMEKKDFDLDGVALSRLDAVKRVASEFVAQRGGDRIGLVIFSDKAYFAVPLTFDLAAVARAINEAIIGISGRSTSISDGLGLTLKRLRDSRSPSRVVILLSDGVSTVGSVAPVEVGNLAAELGITVHTIALGPSDLAAEPSARDAVDSATLSEIATASGGRMFRVKTLADLEAVSQEINLLEPTPTDSPPLMVYRSFWTYPAAMALAFAGMILMRRRGAM